MARQDREYEIVVFGATGYTGKLTAQYITTHLPINLKWAVSGRSAPRLEAVVNELRVLNPDRPNPGIETADLNFESLSSLAKKTHVLISTVGPYTTLGEPVVEACVKNGTHYLDCTGEIPWVKRMIEKYDTEAKANGAIIIPQCGVESVPADLISWTLVNLVREKFSKNTKEVIVSIVGLDGGFSGGTLTTLFTSLETLSFKELLEASKPWALSPVEGAKYGRSTSLLGLRTVPDLGTLTPSPIADTDRSVVHRTWGLLDGGRAYGMNFRYNEYVKVRNVFTGLMFRAAFGAAMLAILFPPIRWLLKRSVYSPGQGPPEETFAKNHISVKAVAIADENSPSAQRAAAEFQYPGGPYHFTGASLAEAAMVILRDDTVAKTRGGGFLTPATLGQPFIDRLAGAEFKIQTRVLDH
ncbi:MAG: hypothetical protein M1839_007032 [Geoglossum umbratile]|nr:MAG: hypothetical protein M1839_007032 [Geoglossum umbratile]